MKLIVGLGNPGPKYHLTRHNIGFEVLNAFADRHFFPSARARFEGLVTDATVFGEKVVLLAPQTYMNASGRSVRQCVDFFKVERQDLLILLDDMNLPLGRLRLRPGGSAGGQKGLADIIRHSGDQEIPRLRIGIGRPPGRMSGSDFVLHRFTEDERETMDVTVQDAVAGLENWIQNGLESAMNSVNQPKTDDRDRTREGESEGGE